MPAANLSSKDVNAASIRVPKLAVRNRTLSDTCTPDIAKSIDEQPERRDGRPSLSSHSSEGTLVPSFVRRQSDQSQQSLDSLDHLRRGASHHRSSNSPMKDAQTKPKKKSGVLGFLTLKEPSTSAWEVYAETQKNAGKQKGGRSTAVGLPGVSSQRLPDTVPPTNSKWDGLPESSKRNSMMSKTSSKRMSTFSTSTKQTNRSVMSSWSESSGESSSRMRHGSVSSKPPRSDSVSLPPSKRGSMQSSLSAPPVTSCTKPASPSPNSIVPHTASRGYSAVTPWDEPLEVETEAQAGTERRPSLSASILAEPKHGRQTFLHSPSPPPQLPEPPSLLPTPELELPEPPLHYTSSPERSPRTPPANHDIEHVPSIAHHLGGHELALDQPGTFWHSDTDNEAEVTKVSRSSARGVLKNFSRPMLKQAPVLKPEMPLGPVITEEQGDEEGDDGEQVPEKEDECEKVMLASLRDERGRTSPFVFEEPVSHEVPLSRLRSTTVTTQGTAAAPMLSPTFSMAESDSTRPSTAASGIAAVAGFRTASLSPIRSNSDATSLANSEMSALWTMSPKERLGLGSKMTRQEQAAVVPWETEDGPAADVQFKRPSTAMSSNRESGKLKRLSLRLSKKG